MHTVGVVTAALFAVFSGINDGGALLVTSLKIAVRPLAAALVFAVAVALVPAVFGAEVARTLSHRLVGFGGPDAGTAVVLAVVGSIVVVVVLSWRGLPTSLTLALVGGIVGVGVGGGLPISGTWVLTVLVLAAVAPLIGMVLAVGIARLWRWLPLRMAVGEQARRAHRLGLAMLAFAYGANDGQKILGVFALEAAAGSPFDPADASVWLLLAIGGLFLLGTLIGTARTGDRLGAALRTFTPVDAVTAQLSGAAAVTGSALVGAPASMTQSLTGALVGCGLAHSGARIRWQHAVAILTAWVLTFPLAVVLVAVPAVFLIRW